MVNTPVSPRENRPARAPLNPEQLIAATPAWRRVHVKESTGSTNADVLAMLDDDAPDRIAIVASNQTAGRGRLSRVWESPAGASLAISVLFKPQQLAAEQLGLLPLVSGLAVVDMIVNEAGIPASDVGLKWPNDVLVRGRKICGILVEAGSIDPPALVPGIGINVDLLDDELPVPHATSLTLEGAKNVNRTELAAALLNALDRREYQWRIDTASLMADYRSWCRTIGTEVRVELPGGNFLTGKAVDVRDDGELIVTDKTGTSHVVAAGDVQHLRNAEGGYSSGGGAR
ncbi:MULTISPECIES: biotin--[acetyl-CoA-carboxylase] ligase [unclassified Corynebacterium]|uniref:biotin--[acetyl-CoA-carboxylase] ligase n=1 Tax=unclassified Corynebacterium TaxID=2624378 RepID=UPI00309B4847